MTKQDREPSGLTSEQRDRQAEAYTTLGTTDRYMIEKYGDFFRHPREDLSFSEEEVTQISTDYHKITGIPFTERGEIQQKLQIAGADTKFFARLTGPQFIALREKNEERVRSLEEEVAFRQKEKTAAEHYIKTGETLNHNPAE